MKVSSNGIEMHYTVEGPEDAPVVVMSHSLASSNRMWDPQMPVLSDYRVYRFDTRGHGDTDAPEGPYDLDMLADDAKGLLDALGLDKVHFVGLSMGGMIGQYLAIKYPEVLLSVSLCATSSCMPEGAGPAWQERIDTARAQGMDVLLDGTIERWFSAEFIAANESAVGPVRELVRTTPVQGYASCIGAIMKINLTDRLKSTNVPTLIIAGEDDESTPVAAAEAIHGAIAGSELVVIPSAKHFVNVEQSGIFNDTLTRFLSQQVGRTAQAAE